MSVLREMFERLTAFFAVRPPQVWWPSDPLEVIVGAVLVPGTSWKNVAAVLQRLKEDGLLNISVLLQMNRQELEERIRPVGFQPKKARCLQEMMRCIQDTAEGELDRFLSQKPESLRKLLLSVYNIGPATADNILLYAGKQAVYSADKFTRRILQRHGIVPPKATEREFHATLNDLLHGGDAEYFNRLQAFLVRVGREYCGASVPVCSDCPLAAMLPPGGIILDKFVAVATPSNRREYGTRYSTGTNIVMNGDMEFPDHDDVNSCHFEQFDPTSSSTSSPLSPPHTHPLSPLLSQPSLPLPPLSEPEQRVYDLVERNSTPIDTVIEKSGLPTHQVLAVVCGLEMKRLVIRGGGNTIVRTNR